MTERARCCLQRWVKKVLRPRAQAVEKTTVVSLSLKAPRGAAGAQGGLGVICGACELCSAVCVCTLF